MKKKKKKKKKSERKISSLDLELLIPQALDLRVHCYRFPMFTCNGSGETESSAGDDCEDARWNNLLLLISFLD
jgi:hypothetical protein